MKPAIVRATDRFWGFDGEFTYGRCPICGTWVLDPRPDPPDIGPYYAGYYAPAELEFRREAMRRYPPARALGLEWLRGVDFVRRLRRHGLALGAGQRVLDAGCGAGGFLRSVREQTGAEVRGVDFNPTCAAFADETYGVPVDVGELAGQGYPDDHFDAAASWHCLEHTYDPAAELREMARVLRPGGLVMLEVPHPGVVARVFRGRWLFLQAPTHLYHLRPTALRALLAQAGLTPVWLRRPWLPSEVAGSLLLAAGLHGFAPRILRKGGPLRDRLWRLAFGLALLVDVPVTLALALFGDSGVMRVVARKEAR